jgi:hypothetical protein
MGYILLFIADWAWCGVHHACTSSSSWTDGRDSTLRLTSNINFLLSGIGSLTEETLP